MMSPGQGAVQLLGASRLQMARIVKAGPHASNWKATVIHGTYRQARFFNFNTYTATGSLIGTLYDAQIALIVGVGIRLRRRPAPEPRTIRSRSAPIIWDRTIPSALQVAASPLSSIASIWLTQGWTEPAASASLR
jgi:hypothetical protein